MANQVRLHCLALLCLALFVVLSSVTGVRDPDQDRDIIQLIESRGFQVEVHDVTTEDDYILTVFRIINPENSDSSVKLKPVMIQHGLIGSSDNFVVNTPFLRTENSTYGDNLAFSLMLTNRYDVWLANSRGSIYSLRHKTLTRDDNEYWNFSFHEMALYDLPATIEHIREHTNSSTVAYIGHSQGTTVMFAMLSMLPHYGSVVRPFISLGTAVFFRHLNTPMSYLAAYSGALKYFPVEFPFTSSYVNDVAQLICQDEESYICTRALYYIGGYNEPNLNRTRVKVYMHFGTSSTSTKNFQHFAQMLYQKRFMRFDYGTQELNEAKYGANCTLDYPLHHIPSDTKIAFFRGKNDVLSTEEDVNYLKDLLQTQANITLIEDHYSPSPYWNHLDYIFGLNAGYEYIDRLIELMDQYA